MTSTPSQAAIDLCVESEVSSRAYYVKHYQQPEWPGEQSGITVAVGYDLGQASAEKIRRDWSSLVDPQMLEVMVSCSGVTGDKARLLLPRVRDKILVPWTEAVKVFAEVDVPETSALLLRHLPAAAELPPHCFGSLFDLVYNRGASFDNSADRYREMRAIKAHVTGHEWDKVPGDLRSMKRLWPRSHGLTARRDAEADLFQRGLSAPVSAQPSPAVIRDAPAQKQLASHPAGHRESGGAAATAAAAAAALHGSVSTTVLCVAALVAGGAAFLAVRANRAAQPVTARAKS